MKKMNFLIGLSILVFLSVTNADKYTTTNTQHPTGTSQESSHQNVNKMTRSEKRHNRKSMAMAECDSTDLQCMHDLKTGSGQDSYSK